MPKSRTLSKVRDDYDNITAAVIFAVCAAYKGLYGAARVGAALDDLEELTSPDARKLDLFFRGVLTAIGEAAHPEHQKSLTRIFGKPRGFAAAMNDALMLQPNIFGVGINLNEILTRILRGG